MYIYKVNIRCSTKDIQVMIDKLKMIFSLNIAFSCDSLRFASDTPILALQPDGNYTLTFVFEHGNTGGDYTCFLREQESCPRVSTEISCLPSPNNITFTVLDPGVWYTCGVRCQLGNVVRSIARGIATPAADGDCVPLLINDGISFFNYTSEGNATTCFMWSSSDSPSGFQCAIDGGTSVDCESTVCMFVCVWGGAGTLERFLCICSWCATNMSYSMWLCICNCISVCTMCLIAWICCFALFVIHTVTSFAMQVHLHSMRCWVQISTPSG